MCQNSCLLKVGLWTNLAVKDHGRKQIYSVTNPLLPTPKQQAEAPNSTGESPMTINACGPSQDQVMMNMPQERSEENTSPLKGGTPHLSSLEVRETSHLSIHQEHQNEGGELKTSLKTGDYVSEIASRIGASLDEVGCRNLKTLGAHQPQESSDGWMETSSTPQSSRDSTKTITAGGLNQDQVM
jgi:hypothetical protein